MRDATRRERALVGVVFVIVAMLIKVLRFRGLDIARGYFAMTNCGGSYRRHVMSHLGEARAFLSKHFHQHRSSLRRA